MKMPFIAVIVLTTVFCFLAPTAGCAIVDETEPVPVISPVIDEVQDEVDVAVTTGMTEAPDDDIVIEVIGVLLVNPKDLDAVEPEPYMSYTEEDLDLLARIIYAEAGSSWLPDELQLSVGSVILNRMKSELFPDTLYDVVYQPGQYEPTWSGSIHNTPDQRTIDNARYLLENGGILPENVVFQANFKQGNGVYWQYYDPTLGTTSYFCYI